MENLKEIMIKAETLIEALPYIRDFNGKKVVVKYGGSAMLDERLQQSVIKDVALLKLVGMQPIIVHGGGKEISKWLGYMGKESKFVDGLRVTDAETMEVAEMVLSKVNKHLVQMMEKLGVKACRNQWKRWWYYVLPQKDSQRKRYRFRRRGRKSRLRTH